jgi:hypothetical protein
VPTYHCKKITAPFPVDGDLHKPAWWAAEPLELVENVSGGRPRQATRLRMLWNPEHLLAAFECQDDFIQAACRDFNGPLYEEEVVELFIDDNRDRRTYLEFEVNPLNAVLHYAIHHPLDGQFLQFARTQERLTTAVRRDPAGRGWDVELAIPFSEFVTAPHLPPQPGDSWLFNAYRIDRPKEGPAEYSAWSPTGAVNFHLPQYFGELRFVE